MPKSRSNQAATVYAGPLTLRYEAAALTSKQASTFAALAARGIREIRRFLALGPSAAEIRIEVSENAQISATRGRTIQLPGHRVRSGTAPYLHEIVHALLPCRQAPLWFSEGLACYVESAVAERGGGYDSGLFAARGNAGVNADAVRWLGDPRGRAVLWFVGTRGMPPRLAEDRLNVAAPFYVLSHSLVKFIAQRVSIHKLAGAARASRFARAVRRATGRTMPQWRDLWLSVVETKDGGHGQCSSDHGNLRERSCRHSNTRKPKGPTAAKH